MRSSVHLLLTIALLAGPAVARGDAPPLDAFVVFERTTAFSAGVAAVRDAGLPVGTELPAAHAVHTWGAAPAVEGLASLPAVADVQPAGVEPVLLTTATWASRARMVREGTLGLDLTVRAPNGDPIDGRGVGVAVIDTGIDATHPDLRWAGFGEDDPTTIKNLKVACGNHVFDPERLDFENGCFGPTVFQDVPNSDNTGGHGTHVAGIVAADGAASDGAVQGVAPGAALYGFGAGEGRSVLTASVAASMQWIIDNGATQDPPIRVVNGSFGGVGPHDPDFVISVLTRELIARGITVVFAAGNGDRLNDGGDGSEDLTTGHSKNPTPGVLSVANYDDDQTGTRDNALDDSSSRGAADDPSTWADLSAPGSLIDSTCTAPHATCNAYTPWYGFASGTSMAAPHVAGIVAMLYQLDPSLTPAEVELLLERTAHPFTAGAPYAADPTNPASDSSFDKGHGLVDARAAVLDLLGLPVDHGVGPDAVADERGIWFSDAPGDVPHGAWDLTGVGVQELDDGSIQVTWEVLDASEPPPNGAQYRLVGSSGATSFDVWVTYGETNTPNGSRPEPLTSWREGNSFHALFSAADLGAARGELLVLRYAGSYWPLIDYAPGGIAGDATLRPGYLPRYVYAGPVG